MAYVEVIDRNSGAILFKKDRETQEFERKINQLEESNKIILAKLEELLSVQRKDSN